MWKNRIIFNWKVVENLGGFFTFSNVSLRNNLLVKVGNKDRGQFSVRWFMIHSQFNGYGYDHPTSGP